MGTPSKGALNTKKFPAIHNDDIKVTLLMRKVTLNERVYVRLQKDIQLDKQPVRNPVVRSEIRTFSFDGRSTQWEQDNVFVGRFPDRVSRVVALRCFQLQPAKKPLFLPNVWRHPDTTEFEWRRIPLQNPGIDRGSRLSRPARVDRFLNAMGAYNKDKIPMLLSSDWGEDKNCTSFMFNNVPSGKADDPQYRNPRQSGVW